MKIPAVLLDASKNCEAIYSINEINAFIFPSEIREICS